MKQSFIKYCKVRIPMLLVAVFTMLAILVMYDPTLIDDRLVTMSDFQRLLTALVCVVTAIVLMVATHYIGKKEDLWK